MIAQLKQAVSKSADCPSQSKRQSGVVSQIKDLQAALARKDEVLKKVRSVAGNVVFETNACRAFQNITVLADA